MSNPRFSLTESDILKKNLLLKIQTLCVLTIMHISLCFVNYEVENLLFHKLCANPNKVMQVHLTNIGNGTAVSVAVQPLAMEHSVQHVGPYRFKEIVKIGQGATMPVEKTEASLPRFTDFEVASKTFVLVVHFQDIEGNRYKQEILMAEGICRPQPVAALTSAEIDLQNKVLAEQKAKPRINSYR